MKIKTFGFLGLMTLAGCLSVANAEGEMVKVGDKIADFSMETSAGKTRKLSELLKDGPVYLAFFKEMCSANPRAVQFYNQIHKAYGKKTQFFGVINADKAGFDGWKSQFKAPFETFLDGNTKIIGALGIPTSTYTVMVGTDGKVSKIFGGFGKDALTDLSASLAETAKMEVQKLDLSKAPKNTAFG